MEKKTVKKGIVTLVLTILFAVAAYFGLTLPGSPESGTDLICSDENPLIECHE